MTTSDPPVLVVKDANIIIDLANVGLLELWFSLGIPTITTDLVVLELRKGSQWEAVKPLIDSGFLVVEEFDIPDHERPAHNSNKFNWLEFCPIGNLWSFFISSSFRATFSKGCTLKTCKVR